MAYNNPASWDGLSINDDSFLALLQKQIASANPSSLVLDPTRFPAPPIEQPTPPLSAESSPSPPSLHEKETFMRGFDDEHNKRKAQEYEDSDDEIDGQPQHKTQHRGDTNKKSSRRKSGGANGDESRLLKRKEQNRAAQRAFRERKEKHVKELEDKVAALESKNQNSDRENENLRDLLGRLQNENLLLKQSAFTFSFPGGASAKSPSESAASPARPRQPPSPKLASPSSSSSASTPESVPDQSVYSSLFAGPSTDTSSSASSSNSPRSEATTSHFQSSDLAYVTPDFSNIDFSNTTLEMSGGRPQYTTIAANPMYTSYQDSAFDPMAWGSFGSDFSQAEPDLNLLGMPGGKPDFGGQAFASQPYGSNASAASLDDLFVQNSFVDYNGGFAPAPFASPSTASVIPMEASPSPVLHRAVSTQGSPADGTCETSHGGCPKTQDEIQHIISSNVPSTFGPAVSPPLQRRESDEKDAAAHARMAALCADLPRTAKRPNQIEIGRAWEKVRQHPQFEDCDIDELCNELSAKAKCDGSRPVLEESSFNDIVHALPGMKYKR